MVIYQFSNAGHIFFIVVFSLLILLSIFACIFFFPLLKQSCESIVSIAKGGAKRSIIKASHNFTNHFVGSV